MMLSFQCFCAGDSIEESEDTKELSDIWCCKCLLKLLSEYKSYVFLWTMWRRLGN